MPASAAITNGSLVSETSPSSMLIGSSCACAEGTTMGATAARNSAPNSALVNGFRMIDLPSTHRSGAARLADTASAHHQTWNQNNPGEFGRCQLHLPAYERHTVIKPTPDSRYTCSLRSLVAGAIMKVPSLVSMNKRCAYCNEPFRITEQGIEALPADNKLVCSEFCAQSLREETQFVQKRAS